MVANLGYNPELTDKVYDDKVVISSYMKKKPGSRSETKPKSKSNRFKDTVAKAAKKSRGEKAGIKVPNNEEDVFEKMLNNEYVVNVPPKESYTVTVKISKIIEYEPCFVEHEIWELLDDD